MTLDTMLALARQHLNSGTMESSARLCLADAIDAKDRGDYDAAASWAVRSLSYSVGVFHPAYERATHALRTDAHLPPLSRRRGCQVSAPDSGCDLNGWHGDTLYYDGFPVAGVYASRGSWVAYYDDAQPEGARTFPRRIAAQVAAEGWVRDRLAARKSSPLPTPTR